MFTQDGLKVELLEHAERAARILSLHCYQDCSGWCASLTYSKTFQNGNVINQEEKLEVIAVTGGISSTRLSLEDAIAAAEFFS